MKSIHAVNFLIFVGLACLRTLAGWDIPDLIVVAPLIIMGIYSLAALYLDGRNFYQAMRELGLKAKANKTTEAEVELEMVKSKHRLERQAKQDAKRRDKKSVEGAPNSGVEQGPGKP